MINQLNLEHLQSAFPKLTEANQHYVLGLAEGLKHAQGKVQENRDSILVKATGNGAETREKKLPLRR